MILCPKYRTPRHTHHGVEKNMTTQVSPQVIGNAGLYYACYRLSLLGWNALPTSRNARGIDVIAYNADCSRTISVQVKALSKRPPVPLGKSLDRIMGDFWIIVNNIISSPSAYVMVPAEIRELAHRGEKDGQVSFWLQPNAYDRDEFREAWHRLGAPRPEAKP
jgi:hypothetical protein